MTDLLLKPIPAEPGQKRVDLAVVRVRQLNVSQKAQANRVARPTGGAGRAEWIFPCRIRVHEEAHRIFARTSFEHGACEEAEPLILPIESVVAYTVLPKCPVKYLHHVRARAATEECDGEYCRDYTFPRKVDRRKIAACERLDPRLIQQGSLELG